VSVLFSQVAAQIVVNIDNSNSKSLDEILTSLAKRINLFQNCITRIIPIERQHERGVVLSVHYPVDFAKVSDASVFEFIQSKFLRIAPLGIPANATFTTGYQTDDKLFFTLYVSQYKQYQFATDDINSAIAAKSIVDISKLPLSSSGIELKLDVNSKPLLGASIKPFEVTDLVLKKSFDFILNDADKFMGIQ
jgi:hypothetical protein